jgi:hypothetical protein
MYLQRPERIAIVSRTKLTGFGEHWGVRLPDGRVVDLVQDRGIRIMSAEEFAQSRPVKVIREVPAASRRDVMQRVYVALSERRPYDLLHWNCEQFATWLVGEKPKSPQVGGMALLMTAVALVRGLSRS